MSDVRTTGVVVHLDEAEPAKHAAVIRNILNLLADLDDGSPIVLVAHGPGLDAVVQGSHNTDGIEELVRREVEIAACANTLRSRGLDESGLLPGVRVVPAGVGEIVRRQRQGWAYLRP